MPRQEQTDCCLSNLCRDSGMTARNGQRNDVRISLGLKKKNYGFHKMPCQQHNRGCICNLSADFGLLFLLVHTDYSVAYFL